MAVFDNRVYATSDKTFAEMLSMRISLIAAVSHYLFPLPIPFYLPSFLLNFEGLRKIAHVP